MAEAISAFVQVVLINLVLSGDNAIIVGTAVVGLPAADRLRGLWLGVAAATVLRLVFATVATSLLQILGLLVAGGILLLWVAWKLWREIVRTNAREAGSAPGPTKTFRQAL